MRRALIAFGFALLALAAASALGRAGVRFSIGIGLPAPPPLVPVPASPVLYAPGTPANYFFYAGQYWVFAHGVWYVSAGYNGPWAIVGPAYVPPRILAVPVRYYRVPPRAWSGWRRDAAPHWAVARRPPLREHGRPERSREGHAERRERR